MGRLIRGCLYVLPILGLMLYLYQNHASNFKKLKISDNVHVSYDINQALHQENVAPVAIIGSGPAGLSAALYVARAGMKTVVLAGPIPCGQLTQTTHIENWPGREKVYGSALMDDIKKQAESFGATIVYDTVTEIDFSQWPFSIKTEEGRFFKAMSLILATGATPRTLNIPGEREFWGKGVTTCAVCDARFFKDKDVVIAGGGDSAIEMVFELAPYVAKVTMLVRKGTLRASAAMQKRLKEYPNAHIEYFKEITAIHGKDDHVYAIDVYDNQTKTSQHRSIDGVFLAIGHDPNNKLFKHSLDMDDQGYLKIIDRSQECSLPGVFAAGEIQDPSYRQAIVAAGEGVKAALDATSFLYEIGFNVEIGSHLHQKFFENLNHDKLAIKDLVETQELYDYVLNAKGLVLLDFYALDCPGCIRMLPIMESVAYALQDQAKFYKVNYREVRKRKTIFHELWNEKNIKVLRLPSLLVFKDGEFIEQTNELMSRSQLLKYLDKFL